LRELILTINIAIRHNITNKLIMGDLDAYDRKEQEEFAKGSEELHERNERERIQKESDKYWKPFTDRMREKDHNF
jgi:thiamine pyrophosphokinase